MDCRWNLSSNAKIELAFLRFNTEASNDLVKVYNGGSSSSPLIGTFSGSSLPSPIQSSSRNLYVKFTSDGSGTYKGFLAHYRGKMIVIYVFSYLRLPERPYYEVTVKNFINEPDIKTLTKSILSKLNLSQIKLVGTKMCSL